MTVTFPAIPRNYTSLRLTAIFLLAFILQLQGQLKFSTSSLELGELGAVYEVAGDIIISNDSEQKIHILRATADEGVRVYTSRRTLLPGDTALLVLSYLPKEAGRFSKKVQLLTTDAKGSHHLKISGQIEKVRENDLTACYYFGSRAARSPKTEPVFFRDTAPQRTAPAPLRNIPRPVSTATEPPVAQTTRPAPVVEEETGPLAGHIPNNILLLIDISSSMRDSLKLPLLKSEMHRVIDAIRDVDSVTLITYADSVKVRAEAVSGSEKARLHTIVNSLKARGQTKGKKAILFSQELGQKHFIRDGNNLMILASDGKFRFSPEDQLTWDERQARGEIILTTVAFGHDREAMRTLRQIARKGSGSFIHITRRSNGNERLLEEIKKRSLHGDRK